MIPEIREFVRRDVVGARRQPESDSELVANNINQLLQRVAGTSVQEIDKLITELQTLRDTLQSEAARVAALFGRETAAEMLVPLLAWPAR